MRKVLPLLFGVLAVLFIAGCPTSSTGSSTNELTKFSFLASENTDPVLTDVPGIIKGNNITLTVPYGSGGKALVAHFSTNGKSVTVKGISQKSGTTKNDFSKPLTYVVTAEDGSTRNYTVTVKESPPKTTKELTRFGFFGFMNDGLEETINGTIEGQAITLTVPYGTDVTALVAAITTTGAHVSIAGTTQERRDTPNNFSKPITYTITAEDGSTQDYTVTVTIAKNNAKELMDFRFLATANTALDKDVAGTASGQAIALTVPFGTELTALKASFSTSTGARVTVADTVQTSGITPNDFTGAVTYTVTAADGSTQDYTVTVTIAKNSAKELTDFRFLATANTALNKDVAGVVSGQAIALTVPYETDVTALTASFSTSTGARVAIAGTTQISGTTSNNFTGALTYTVRAEDGSTQDYTVTVTITKNNAKELADFRFLATANTALNKDVAGTISGQAIALTVPYKTDVTALKASFSTSTGARVTVAGTTQISGTTSNNFTGALTYTVRAEDGSTQDYTVTVTIAKNSAKELTDFRFLATANTALNKDVAGTASGQAIALTVPFGTDVTTLTASFSTSGKSVAIAGTNQTSGTTSNDFTGALTYTVTAEDGSQQDYTVTVSIDQPEVIEEAAFRSTDQHTLGYSVATILTKAMQVHTMIYANGQASLTFPAKVDDTDTATLTHRFWMGKTEITNELFAAVYQWAYENNKFSTTNGSPNFVDTTSARYGGQTLIALGEKDCYVIFKAGIGFSRSLGKWGYPVTNVSWYGAIMFSNWLTEMRDGTTDNVVYSGMDDDWLDTETIEDPSKNGYRLPSSDEWEYAARYRGTDTVNVVDKIINSQDFTAMDLKWTKGNSASDATANDASSTGRVAVYNRTSSAKIKSLPSSTNTLGVYDMSGNVKEWCFTRFDDKSRVNRGGAWNDKNVDDMAIGIVSNSVPTVTNGSLGFRLCRTAD